MSPLARKEIRLLLPAWAAALLVATMPLWPWQDFFKNVAPIAIGAALLAVALSPFGLETSHGTFGLLLVQPAERRRFWRVKTALLAAALATVWVLFIVCYLTRPAVLQEDFTVFKVTVLMTVLAFSGGLWTTLLLRDMVSSLFCAFLVPAMLCSLTIAVVGRGTLPDSDHRLGVVVFYVLGIYAVAGIFWARRLFFNAQDLAWTGGQVSLMSGRWFSLRLKERQSPWAALVRKELQLQEVMVIVIPIFLVLHVVALVAGHNASVRLDREMSRVAVPAIWLMTVPLIIGCAAVAEERRLNTFEGQLCLPMTKRAQFAVKFAVAMILGIVLGGIVPGALAIGSHEGLFFNWRYPLEAAAAVTFVAFYASTMSRGLLQAIPTTLCASFLGTVSIGITAAFLRRFAPLLSLENDNMLLPALAVPVMVMAFFWLSFRNFKQLQTGWRLWTGNFLRAGAVYCCAVLATMAVFNRFWQQFQTLEAPHGPARLSGPGRAQIGMAWKSLAVLLPDGRLWIGQIKHIALNKEGYDTPASVSGGFAPGADWTKLAASVTTALALKSDGTLWFVTNKSTISQVGSDADWAQVDGNGSLFMIVKQNGTLWHLVYDVVRSHGKPPRRVLTGPVRVGDESDWVNIFVLEDENIGIKRDDGVWAWGNLYMLNKTTTVSIDKKVRLAIDGTGVMAVAGWGGWAATLFLRNDGTVWAMGNLPGSILGARTHRGEPGTVWRVGTKSDWATLDGRWAIAALEADGTLWTSCLNTEYAENIRPSRYSDWLAASQSFDLTAGLAKDGTLTCWDRYDVPWPEQGATFWQKIYLGPSRRPLYSLNILDSP